MSSSPVPAQVGDVAGLLGLVGARVHRLIGQARVVRVVGAGGEEVGHDAAVDFVARVPELVFDGDVGAGHAALVGQFRPDVALGEALDLVAAVAGLRLEQLLAARDGRHLRQVADGELLGVVGGVALGAGRLHVLRRQQRRQRLLERAVRLVLHHVAPLPVVAGGTAEGRERVLLEVGLVQRVGRLVFRRRAGLRGDAVGQQLGMDDAQVLRRPRALDVNAGVRADGRDQGARLRVRVQVVGDLVRRSETPSTALMMFSAVICGFSRPMWQLWQRSTRICCEPSVSSSGNCVTVTCLTSMGASSAASLTSSLGASCAAMSLYRPCQ